MGGIKKIDGINIGKNLEKGGQKKKLWKKPGKKLILPWWVKNEEKKLKKLTSKIHKSVYSWVTPAKNQDPPYHPHKTPIFVQNTKLMSPRNFHPRSDTFQCHP